MYFENVQTLDELKAVYRKLAMKHHPDVGGDTETMQRINAEYEAVFERLKAEQNNRAAADTTGKTYATAEQAADFIEIINKLIRMDGLVIELCGRWLWISGDTMKHKDELKAAGCRWSSQKKMWSWHFPEDGGYKKHKAKSMSYIRARYGSSMVGAAGNAEQLTA